MSTKGCADVVFCLDASKSMEPCFAGVREHLSGFLSGLQSRGQMAWDLRVDFVVHSAGISSGGGTLLRHSSVYHQSLVQALYGGGQGEARLFTRDVDEFRSKLGDVECEGDEAPIVALDCALDFPWRPSSGCHRIVIMMTDEAMETGVLVAEQRSALPDVISKIQKLRVMLYMVAPESTGFTILSQVDKSEYEQVDVKGDGLRTLDFGKVLGYIGKSVSAASLQTVGPETVKRGLFGQESWGSGGGSMRGA